MIVIVDYRVYSAAPRVGRSVDEGGGYILYFAC